MAIIGFNYSKIDCEKRNEKSHGGIEVKHNINISSVTKTKIKLGGVESEVLKIDFKFEILYGITLGKILIEGHLLYTDTKEIIEEAIKIWESEKKLIEMISKVVFTFIYNKTTIKVLEFADLLNLPAPIPLPKINFSKKEDK